MNSPSADSPPPPRKLVFFEDDVARANKALAQFQEATSSKANVLLDCDGQVFTQTGATEISPQTLAALVSSSYAATREVAKILPPDEFASITHQGERESIQLTDVAERTILATVFDARTTVPVIVFFLKDLREELCGIVKEVAERKDRPVDLGAGFEDAAHGALDDVFGDG